MPLADDETERGHDRASTRFLRGLGTGILTDLCQSGRECAP
jgi:hypothetical protein